MKNTDPITIDCNYIQPHFAASYLLIENGKAAFIETNTSHSAPILLKELSKQGLSPNDVEYIIVTHAHLDHAGGASAMMSACPHATLLAHPKTALHMSDPAKLISGAEAVYGKEKFKELYGEITPVAKPRIREMNDSEELKWGNRLFKFLHTLGHANHHFCVLEIASRSIYTGDSFGLAYPDLQKKGLFIFPSTSPTGYDPEEAIRSVERIVKTGAKTAYLTHFGRITLLKEAAMQLTEHLNWSRKLFREVVDRSGPIQEEETYCLEKMKNYYTKVLAHKDLASDTQVWELMKLDLELNAAGIAYSGVRARSKG